MIKGTWPEDDIRRAFVAGAKWWEYRTTGATMWQSDRNLAEEEAERRYPGGAIPPNTASSATAPGASDSDGGSDTPARRLMHDG